MKRYYKVIHTNPQPPVDKLSYPQRPVDSVDKFLNTFSSHNGLVGLI